MKIRMEIIEHFFSSLSFADFLLFLTIFRGYFRAWHWISFFGSKHFIARNNTRKLNYCIEARFNDCVWSWNIYLIWSFHKKQQFAVERFFIFFCFSLAGHTIIIKSWNESKNVWTLQAEIFMYALKTKVGCYVVISGGLCFYHESLCSDWLTSKCDESQVSRQDLNITEAFNI